MEKSQKRRGKDVVGTNPHKNLVLAYAIIISQAPNQGLGRRVRIFPKPACIHILHCLFHP